MAQEFPDGSGSGTFSAVGYYRAVANLKEPMSHKRGKHIERKYHLIREIVSRGDVKVSQIVLEDNLADPFIKGLTQKTFDRHVEGMRVRCIVLWL